MFQVRINACSASNVQGKRELINASRESQAADSFNTYGSVKSVKEFLRKIPSKAAFVTKLPKNRVS